MRSPAKAAAPAVGPESDPATAHCRVPTAMSRVTRPEVMPPAVARNSNSSKGVRA
ncbi:hypothetical protein [Methylobacterium variabile]|jgi:hypothetical protein|uniref:hypothetical protein n=1 Tax=Methylobacterium variabile TaxID=298794 RepID=UPI0012EDECF9|nr:hypothetical protein [Methylobacterium variabile]